MKNMLCRATLMALCALPLFSCGSDELEENPGQEQQAGRVMQISSVEDLLDFAKRVDAGELSLDAKLTADIDLTGRLWTPIGYQRRFEGYQGRFMGDNHVIKGMRITEEHALQFSNSEPGEEQYISSIGLFSSISYDGSVEEVVLEDVSIETPHISVVGGIAGESSGYVLRCKVKGKIEAYRMVGGLVGMATNVSAGTKVYENIISAGYNYADVKGESYVGGIVGGTNGYLMVSRNYGRVSSDVAYAGGLTGVSGVTSKLYNLENYGEVAGAEQTGGIVGVFSGILCNSINYASVSGSSEVGGIAGSIANADASWLVDGEEKHHLSACVNYGSIEGASDSHAVAGVIRASQGVKVQTCYYDSSVSMVNDSEASELSDFSLDALNGWVSNASPLHADLAYKRWSMNDKHQLILVKP